MASSDEIKKRRKVELAECFSVIDTCLSCYYRGEQHMYRPLAGQLRILFCDKPLSLIERVFPAIEVLPLNKIEWLAPNELVPFRDKSDHRIMVHHPTGQEYQLAKMPFVITEYSNGLQTADLELDPKGKHLSLHEWLSQPILITPVNITIKEIIKSIADKGGGAHVDDAVNEAMRELFKTAPAGVGGHVLFIVALARLAQSLGLHYIQLQESIGAEGKSANISFDPQHPSVDAGAKVPRELEEGLRNRYGLTLLRRVQ